MENQKNNIKKQVIMWIIFAIVVVLVGGYLVSNKNIASYKKEYKNRGEENIALENSQENSIAPGASPITKEGEVIAPSGKPADNAAVPGSENAPAQSEPISKEDVPEQAIKLEVTTKDGFKPNTFTVKRGSPVILSLTSADESTHILRFDDPSLNAIAIGVGPGMTRLIPFKAPETPGEYTFRDEVPGKTGIGKMIVK